MLLEAAGRVRHVVARDPQHGRLEGVRKAGLILATTALLPAFAQAQQPACDAAIARATLATQVVASAVATGVEYGDMERQPTWRFSPDRDRAAIIACPSSLTRALALM